MSYQDDEDFKNAKLIYMEMDEKISELHEKASSAKSLEEKLSYLKKLAKAIVESDAWLSNMITDFPDYYSDRKQNLDRIQEKTSNYLYSTLNFITSLENNGSN